MKKDENYVLDICDEILGVNCSRQHKFDFLRGDKDRKGKGRRLPVDGYYEKMNFVIEYYERQHTEPVPFFDKPDKMTVSSVPRSEQRRIYDERRKTTLKDHKIDIVILSYSDFNFDSQKRIIRDREYDSQVIRRALAKWL